MKRWRRGFPRRAVTRASRRCAAVAGALPGYAREGLASRSVRRHVASCQSCREEVERYKLLTSSLQALRSSVAEVPPALALRLVEVPTQRSLVKTLRGHVVRYRRAYVGGAVALAGATGAALWRNHSRHLAAS